MPATLMLSTSKICRSAATAWGIGTWYTSRVAAFPWGGARAAQTASTVSTADAPPWPASVRCGVAESAPTTVRRRGRRRRRSRRAAWAPPHHPRTAGTRSTRRRSSVSCQSRCTAGSTGPLTSPYRGLPPRPHRQHSQSRGHSRGSDASRQMCSTHGSSTPAAATSLSWFR
eukprot:scaffold54234_cov60-Phaeocystis_antarctica.AAC.2